MRFLVLGAGMMGSAVAYDLAMASPDNAVLLADINEDAARTTARAIGPNVGSGFVYLPFLCHRKFCNTQFIRY